MAGKIGSIAKLGLAIALVLAGSGTGYYCAVAQQQDAAELRYQTCLNNVGAAHDASWADNCKSLAQKVAAAHADCLEKLKLPKTYCDASYGPRDASPHCALPADIATVLDADLALARDRCGQENKAAAP